MGELKEQDVAGSDPGDDLTSGVRAVKRFEQLDFAGGQLVDVLPQTRLGKTTREPTGWAQLVW